MDPRKIPPELLTLLMLAAIHRGGKIEMVQIRRKETPEETKAREERESAAVAELPINDVAKNAATDLLKRVAAK